MSTCVIEEILIKTTVGTFLDEVEHEIGVANVIRKPNQVRELSPDPVFTTIPPQAFVYPTCTADVSAIVRLANNYGVKIWPYSTGKNWGYCNTAGCNDSVVLILNRMNKILKVDYELAYAEIEAGVTYEQLNKYMRDNNVALWTDCTGGPPSGSVVGNALDRGIGVTPSGDHYANLCGLEVVLPNGKVIRTGGFSNEQEGAWHTYKWGIGPSLEGLFVQSNLGIVTRAGVWLMRTPSDFVVGALKLTDSDQLAPAIDALRELMLQGILPEKARFSNDVALFTLITQAREEDLSDAALTTLTRAALREKYRVPFWTASFGIYGTSQHVRLNRREVTQQLKRLGGLSFAGDIQAKWAQQIVKWAEGPNRWIARVANFVIERFIGTTLPVLRLVSELVDIHKGIPNESVVRRAYFRFRSQRPTSNIHVAKDRIGVLWFVPLLKNRGADITTYLQHCEKEFARCGFDFYVTIMILNARTAVPLMVILYDITDEDSCKRAKDLYDSLYADALERGYQQFRCAHLGWDKIFADVPDVQDVYEVLKESLDPNGILAPGRYGVGQTC